MSPWCPFFFAFANFWKYFCAWVRIWTTVRVLINLAIFFQPFPCISKPFKNKTCSSQVHRPVFSRPVSPSWVIEDVPLCSFEVVGDAAGALAATPTVVEDV